MDGFAVRGDDIKGASASTPRSLRIVESIAAGEFASKRVEPGQAIGIMTGAPIPDGADCVVRVEHTRDAGADRVEIVEDGDVGRNIRPKGEDVRRGETVLEPGRALRPGEIGVLAMLGHGRAPVHRRPRVGILATGDELVDVDGFAEVEAGRRIVNSNSYALDAAVRAVGGDPVQLGIAIDDVDAVLARLERIDTLDALLTTAGASVGEHDLVKDALERIGMRTLFWRVRMRPGSPFSFGLIPRPGSADLPVFGLPGNPVSAVVTFEVLGKPALRRMTGRSKVHAATRTVRIAERIGSKAGLVRFLRVHLDRDGDGGWSARLTGEQGSGMLTSVARADALLVVPLDASGYEEGESAVVLVLDPPDPAADAPGF
jgi:molybdopterin molybdotransferase